MSWDAAAPEQAGRATDLHAQATILVVDDSRATRRILRRGLEEAGYGVAEAGNGQEALSICRELTPDLVLLDVDMPVLDGPATLVAMRADPALKDVPVLFLTARTSASDLAAGLTLGAQDYLRKPCDAVELVARVATALRRSEQEAALRDQARRLDDLSATDPLTGLGNRRRLDLRRQELVDSQGGEASVGVLLADVDHFKVVNDTYGHGVGDTVLQIVAARLRTILHNAGTLVRWGGEEFLAVVAGAADDPSEGAMGALAEQMRHAVGDSALAAGTKEPLRVTISVGGAVGRLADLDGLIRAADLGLYAAKQAGRNRVELRGL